MKKKMKHLLLLVLILCLAFLAYVLIGAIAPFTVQPEISAATQAAFHAGDYYGHGALARTGHGWWTTTRKLWSSGSR